MRIAVIGAGYVGLVTGTCLAETGNDVVLVDTDPEKIKVLRRGECPIYEAGLERLIQRNVKGDRLAFTTDTASAVKGRQVVFICVSTPPGENGQCDTRNIESAARALAPALAANTIVALKSTAPVGTTAKIREWISAGTQTPFHVASNPEFLKEGTAVNDFLKPDRIIIGSDNPVVFETLEALYAPFVRTNKPILRMDIASSELSKYAANAYLAMRISYVNELALLTGRVGADISAVRRAIGSDPRIGEGFLFPGPGYGGSCFPKDVLAYRELGRSAGLTLELAEATHRVNERQKQYVLERTIEALGGQPKGKRAAIWGLSFKAGTDDCRDSASLTVIEGLHSAGVLVTGYDPEARERNLGDVARHVRLVQKPYDALEDADVLVILTEWNEFREPDFERMKSLLKSPVVVDGRNLYRKNRIESLGFRYFGIGGHRT
ncbi:MAG: UDP-glucose/GDP-mannose dehydrogenase family protein [Deltaproteobacteria bacterium]|nr:UDP-glucose/GDP-mannose dehydrogenase family protein [Deltaproteobacteria bacterium]